VLPTYSPRRVPLGAAALVALAWFVPAFKAQAPDIGLTAPATERVDKLDDLRRQALDAEQRGDWLKACWRYDEIVRRDRTNTAAREAYHRCLRRHQITVRHNDPGYRDAVASLSPSQALAVYVQVLDVVRPGFVDRRKSDLTTLFKHGVTELLYALEDEAFLREHLAGVTGAALEKFRSRLKDFPERRLTNTTDAREQINAVLQAATRAGLPEGPELSVAVTLEFASGACSGLDEYTLFFNPSQFGDLMASWRGKYAGVGAELAVDNGQLLISRVYDNSPAAEAKLQPGMHVLRIDELPTAGLPAYYASDRLRGVVGTYVELVIGNGSETEATYKLQRRQVTVGTVDTDFLRFDGMPVRFDGMPDGMPDLAYLRISSFQDNTVQEVREALAYINTISAVKGVILDLRGNPGGSFKAAVQVSELFLPEGSVIVVTKGTVKDFDQPFRVGSMNAFPLPMVVLVDGDTASAAEVVAGALKEHGRARLMGQTTFGKGTIQVLIPLEKPPLQKTPGGIRITVAKFSWAGISPDGGRGIVPNDFVGPDTVSLINAARQHLRAAVSMMMAPQ
jgi:carboxyl-terminal processing protease